MRPVRKERIYLNGYSDGFKKGSIVALRFVRDMINQKLREAGA